VQRNSIQRGLRGCQDSGALQAWSARSCSAGALDAMNSACWRPASPRKMRAASRSAFQVLDEEPSSRDLAFIIDSANCLNWAAVCASSLLA